ncbi:hypothetical protein [uncultured Shimia sp.]|uniref:hypothetical protein n=1 Tax=uncultured Shimia sp. TaxID=573152 RepID=UPI00261F7CAA|nr:hypothetical protein [uncultured Shimia sp.]
MKETFLAVCFALCSTPAFAEYIEGSMDCTINSQKIIGIEEGKPVEYSGYEDSLSLGDSLRVTYSTHGSDSMTLSVNFGNTYQDILIDSAMSGDGIVEVNSTRLVFSDHFSDSLFSPDTIKMSKQFLGNRTLSLRRYYKNDWQGMYVSSLGISIMEPGQALQSVYVMTFDCRQSDDNIEAIISSVAKAISER